MAGLPFDRIAVLNPRRVARRASPALRKGGQRGRCRADGGAMRCRRFRPRGAKSSAGGYLGEIGVHAHELRTSCTRAASGATWRKPPAACRQRVTALRRRRMHVEQRAVGIENAGVVGRVRRVTSSSRASLRVKRRSQDKEESLWHKERLMLRGPARRERGRSKHARYSSVRSARGDRPSAGSVAGELCIAGGAGRP